MNGQTLPTRQAKKLLGISGAYFWAMSARVRAERIAALARAGVPAELIVRLTAERPVVYLIRAKR